MENKYPEFKIIPLKNPETKIGKIFLGIIFIVIGSLAIYLISNRKKLFARIRSKDIEKFTKGEMLNPGSQMGEIMES